MNLLKTHKNKQRFNSVKILGAFSTLIFAIHGCSNTLMPFDQTVAPDPINPPQEIPTENEPLPPNQMTMMLEAEATDRAVKLFPNQKNKFQKLSVEQKRDLLATQVVKVTLKEILDETERKACKDSETPVVALVEFKSTKDMTLSQNFRSKDVDCVVVDKEQDVLETLLRPMHGSEPVVRLYIQRKHSNTAEDAAKNPWIGGLSLLKDFNQTNEFSTDDLEPIGRLEGFDQK